MAKLPGDIGERMFRALCVQLIRSGKLSPQDIEEASQELAAQGDEEAAHSLQCFTLHAAAPSMAEWHAELLAKKKRDYAAYLERQRKADGGNSSN